MATKNAAPSCPSPQDLSDYQSEKLEPDKLVAIARHVLECTACAGLLEGKRRTLELGSPGPEVSQEHVETLPVPRKTDAESTISRVQEKKSPAAADDEKLPEKIGKYFVLRFLGKGGFARVYLARDPDDPARQVAIKVPRLRGGDVESAIAQFLEETRTVGNLRHPRIVDLYDWGRDEQVGCYVVMQYVDGRTLADIFKSERLDPRRVCDIVIDVAEALEFVHAQGRVHRDVKPANILVDRRGWLSDFGLTFAEQDRWAHAEERAGTPAYMAPEQVRGESPLYRGLGDVWSLGVVLYEGLTGRRPFSGETDKQLYDDIERGIPVAPRAIEPAIPRALERICLRCLEKRPENRCKIGELLSALRRWRRGQKLRKMLAAVVPAASLLVAALLFYLTPARVEPVKDPAAPVVEAKPARSAMGVVPAPVYNATLPGNLFHVDTLANTLQLVSNEYYLVSLGRVDRAQSVVIRIAIKAIGEQNEAGMFVGFRRRDVDTKSQFQTITLKKRANKPPQSHRLTMVFHPDNPMFADTHGLLPRAVKSYLSENTIEVRLSKGQVTEIAWNGDVIETSQVQAGADELRDVSGLFGVYTYKSSAVFSQLVVNEQIQTFEQPTPAK